MITNFESENPKLDAVIVGIFSPGPVNTMMSGVLRKLSVSGQENTAVYVERSRWLIQNNEPEANLPQPPFWQKSLPSKEKDKCGYLFYYNVLSEDNSVSISIYKNKKDNGIRKNPVVLEMEFFLELNGKPSIDLNNIYVNPAYRRKGIFKSFFQGLVTLFQGSIKPGLNLAINATNVYHPVVLLVLTRNPLAKQLIRDKHEDAFSEQVGIIAEIVSTTFDTLYGSPPVSRSRAILSAQKRGITLDDSSIDFTLAVIAARYKLPF